ncbi:hypothetical protein [Streptomyces europaeiscabiei]|uniref:hypothetical protein n=1 Tax=Streptomyces europaeiscabiei TaxID=146819 RepID=UPI002E2BDF98|nr:hypothetical protein [Streptomyces europaeiscabiei]
MYTTIAGRADALAVRTREEHLRIGCIHAVDRKRRSMTPSDNHPAFVTPASAQQTAQGEPRALAAYFMPAPKVELPRPMLESLAKSVAPLQPVLERLDPIMPETR